jgi:hypothetical protein
MLDNVARMTDNSEVKGNAAGATKMTPTIGSTYRLRERGCNGERLYVQVVVRAVRYDRIATSSIAAVEVSRTDMLDRTFSVGPTRLEDWGEPTRDW